MNLTLPPEGYCRAKQAHTILGCSRSTFYAKVKSGEFPQPVKLGRSSLWRVDDIRQLIEDIGAGRHSGEAE